MGFGSNGYGSIPTERTPKSSVQTLVTLSSSFDDAEEGANASSRSKKRGLFPAGFPSVVIAVLVVLILASGVLIALWHIPEAIAEQNASYYDYIVVGGGPSGIIVATKLAEKLPGLKILLLESGTVSQTSVLETLSQQNTNVLWSDDKFSLNKFDIPLMWSGVASSQGRRRVLNLEQTWSDHHWPIDRTLLARGLGGCGLHNAMIYVRCLPTDLDRWNVSGWDYSDILRRYIEMEEYIPMTAESNRAQWRGTDGRIATYSSSIGVDAIGTRFIQAAKLAGYDYLEQGFNSPDPRNRIGTGYYEFNIRNGIRDSVAQSYLGKGSIPSNLRIQTGVTVTRVLVEKTTTLKATGVEYVVNENGKIDRFMVSINGEIILCTGAIMTPQILANSGIGPDGPVLKLDGVGKNLRDHPVIPISFVITPDIAQNASTIYTIGDELEDYALSVSQLQASTGFSARNDSTDEMLRYYRERLGTLGTPGFAAGGFFRSPYAQDESPDIQVTVFPRQLEPHVTRLQKESDVAFLRSHAMLATVALLQPDASYVVKPSFSNQTLLQDNAKDSNVEDDDPLARILKYRLPRIDLPEGTDKYLSPRDIKRIRWGIEEVRRIQKMEPLHDSTLRELSPGAKVQGELLEAFIAEKNLPNSHWVGSTKVGPQNDRFAVVNERFQVHGVAALRIVNAGVIPHPPNGNTHSTVCVIASLGADMLIIDRNSTI